ncbi:MAG: hypothetical protein ACF8MF_03570 [Phycisphaerales bacterium JB052]
MANNQPPKHDPLNGAQACVVWHPSDRDPSPELQRALVKKGMSLIDADDAHTAFAAASTASRAAKRTILVLDTRETLHDVDRVLGALERFAPQVLCWAHAPGANPPLVPLVQPQSGSRSGSQSESQSANRSGSKSKDTPSVQSDHPPSPLRLVGQTAAVENEEQQATPAKQQAAAVKAQPLSARDVLDADELDALLAGEMTDRSS